MSQIFTLALAKRSCIVLLCSLISAVLAHLNDIYFSKISECDVTQVRDFHIKSRRENINLKYHI